MEVAPQPPSHITEIPAQGRSNKRTAFVKVSPGDETTADSQESQESQKSNDDRKQQHSFLEAAGHAWSTFCGNTSLHGIPHVGRSRGKIRAVLWLLLVLAMLGWLTFNIWTIYAKYQTCTLWVQTSVKVDRKTEFPSVTFCNMNALKKDKVNDAEKLQKLIFKEGNEEGEDSEEEEVANNRTNVRETTLKERMLMALAGMPLEEKQALGYSIDDMVVTCVYAGTKCNISTDFSHFYNEVYGNCYSFNWRQAPSVIHPEDNRLMATKIGPEYGLELIFNVQEYQYTKGQMEAVGMRIVVHSQNQMPFPSDEGISIPPGQLTYVGLKKKLMTRLKGRCTKCVPEGQTELHINMYDEMYGAGYTVNGCLKTCFREYVINECACANPSLPIPVNLSKAGIDICGYGIVDGCFEKAQADFYNDRIRCNCNRHPCLETSYDQTFSAIPWPPVQHNSDMREMLRKRLKKEELDVLYPDKSHDNIKQHLAKLVIYYNDFSVQESTEFLAYDSDQIWPDLGGIFGLYAGISFITLLELGELILDVLIALFQTAPKPLPKVNILDN